MIAEMGLFTTLHAEVFSRRILDDFSTNEAFLTFTTITTPIISRARRDDERFARRDGIELSTL